MPDAGANDSRVLVMHADGTYERCFGCSYDENQPPDYGAFAERYEGCAQVLSVALDLTDVLWYWENPYLDAYVWADDEMSPGAVLMLVPNYWVSGVDRWPDYTRVVVSFSVPVDVADVWWVGYWGRWVDADACFYICADRDGPGGGRPMINIAPGLPYPEGWQDVSVRFAGHTAALGIGAEVMEIPSPVISKTWGVIKSLFQQ